MLLIVEMHESKKKYANNFIKPLRESETFRKKRKLFSRAEG